VDSQHYRGEVAKCIHRAVELGWVPKGLNRGPNFAPVDMTTPAGCLFLLDKLVRSDTTSCWAVAEKLQPELGATVQALRKLAEFELTLQLVADGALSGLRSRFAPPRDHEDEPVVILGRLGADLVDWG
jgi:hypothetical protein